MPSALTLVGQTFLKLQALRDAYSSVILSSRSFSFYLARTFGPYNAPRKATMKPLKLVSILILAVTLGACSTSPKPGSDDRPVIAQFEASPATITKGGSSQLTWDVTGADTVTLDKSGSVKLKGDLTVRPNSTTNYTLTARNAAGDTTKTVTVTVTAPNPGGEGVSQLGIVTLEQSVQDGETSVSAFGVFLSFAEPLENFDPSSPYEGVLDTCTVTPLEDTSPSPLVPDTEFAFVSAGDSLTYKTDTSYATLDKTEADLGGETFVFYMSDPETSLPVPVPANLKLTVPGDAFPTFADVVQPSVASFTLTATADPSSVTPDTTFAWTAMEGDAVVTLDIVSVDPETSDTILVSCIAKDDGAFALPPATQAELGAGFSGTLQSAGRQAFRSEVEGNAVLVVGATSTQGF